MSLDLSYEDIRLLLAVRSHLLLICPWRWHALGSSWSTDMYEACVISMVSYWAELNVVFLFKITYKRETISNRGVVMSKYSHRVSGICLESPGQGDDFVSWWSACLASTRTWNQSPELISKRCSGMYWGRQTRGSLKLFNLSQVSNFQVKVSRSCLKKQGGSCPEDST